MKRKKRILISPLDWGLGHAARCIPIINLLIKEHHEVIIAGEGKSLDLLKKEFPNLNWIKIKGVRIKYYNYIPMKISIMIQIPKILFSIYKEHLFLKRIISLSNIDAVISDNRFGLWNKNIPCAFMTHQLKIKSPFLENLIQKINYSFINRFSQCWIIDSTEKNLAGELSIDKIMPRNYKYIGLISRFNFSKREKRYKYLAIVSGPEPARTRLEKLILKELSKIKDRSLILLGKTEKIEDYMIGNCKVMSHASSKKINQYILESEIILSRPGYSTIMDISKLGANAIFIPTPGQTEQEYLAELYKKRGVSFYDSENNFDLKKSVQQSLKFEGFSINKEKDKLKKIILPFLK